MAVHFYRGLEGKSVYVKKISDKFKKKKKAGVVEAH